MENPYEKFNSTSPNSSEERQLQLNEELQANYGPVHDPLYVVVPISIIYASIFVTGTVGNISTCIVIARNKSMHTATNYYLFSLAISDLLLLVCGMPVEIYQVWSKYPYVFGEVFCILRGLAAETSTNASVLTITAFTAERYVAICHPFLSQTMSKLSRAVKLILFIWLIALICAIPQALQFGIVQFSSRPEDVVCHFKQVIVQHSFELSTFLFFIIPMTLIMVLYVLIGIKLKRSALIKSNNRQRHRRSNSSRVKVGSSRIDRHCRHSRSTRRVLKMLVAVVVAFFICWAPFHMQRLIAIYSRTEDYSMENNNWLQLLYAILTYVSGVLYYFSTTVNPILYNIMSNKFREAFMETLARSCRMSRFSAPRERRSYSSLSRSQQRNPGAYPSRTTAMSGGTAIPQDSTDYSGNSVHEEFRQDCSNVGDVNLPTSEMIRGGKAIKDFSKKSNTDIEMEASDTSLSMLSMSGALTIGGTYREMEHECVDKRTQQLDIKQFRHSISRDLSSSVYDKSVKMQGSPLKLLERCDILNSQIKTTNSKKKWWCLLDWLPGLKNITTSHGLTRPIQEESMEDIGQCPSKHPDEYFMQLHTIKTKDATYKPIFLNSS